MSIKEKFKGFDMITDTLFLKDFTKENVNLQKLEEISKNISDWKTKKLIEKDISLLKWGIEGENNVYFELKNSFLPMICLHDIRIEVGDLSAQIDFLILTNKFFYIFETKHLVGDIRINKNGDFIRVTKDEHGNKKEEGMYNPVTQGERHARILKKFLESKNIFNIPDFPIKSIAILANPKTILDKENAPEHIKDNIYRNDQLVYFLQNEFRNDSFELMISDSKLNFISNEILENNKPLLFNYESKYKLKDDKEYKQFCKNKTPKDNNTELSNDIKNDNSQDKLREKLKELRKSKAKELSLKAYELFTNKQLELILQHMPKTLVELNYLNILPKKGSLFLGSSIIETINYDVKNDKRNDKFSNNYNELKKSLKSYRYNKAKSLSIAEYKIFTNKQLEELLKVKPCTISSFSEVSGFKKFHIDKYGAEIIEIIKKEKIY